MRGSPRGLGQFQRRVEVFGGVDQPAPPAKLPLRPVRDRYQPRVRRITTGADHLVACRGLIN